MTSFRNGGRHDGFTLVELLVVIVIISTLMAIAYPSYTQFVVDTKRTAATSNLLQVADRQQQFFMDNKRYANDLTQLGWPNNPMFIGDDGEPVAAADPDSTYLMILVNVGATTYTAVAAPMNGQLQRDTECGALFLDQTLAKNRTGTADDCWE